MEPSLQERFQQLLTRHTGLQIRKQESAAFVQTLVMRCSALRLAGPEQYYHFLETGLAPGSPSSAEWKRLLAILTNQESYFFRDAGQFALLKQTILPELIEANRERRTLRIWSAGCSTGEEPYSLAMLVEQLLPKSDSWDVFILATDIEENAIDRARHGVFSPWSFRAVDPGLQKRYFRKRQNDYELNGAIRNMVSFRPGNLFTDAFPNTGTGLCDMDLILCRNVFIYFAADTVSVVVRKLAATLRTDGYLMTGHAELNAQHWAQLRAKVYAGSVIYQHVALPIETSPPFPDQFASQSHVELVLAQTIAEPLVRNTAEPSSKTITPLTELEEASALFQNKAYEGTVQKLENFLQSEPLNYAALWLAAQANANLGRHEAATRYCDRAIDIDPFAPLPYTLLAHIAEEKGESDEARRLLLKLIYLAPGYIPAYLDLSDLHLKRSEDARAQKLHSAAIELLRAMAPEAIIEPYETTAQELIEHLLSKPLASMR